MSRSLGDSIRLNGFQWRAMNSTWTVFSPWQPYEIEQGKPDWQDIITAQTTRFEQTLSRFLPDSELCKLNKLTPGETVSVSALMHTVLKDSIRMHQETGGWYNPFLGDQIRHLGYDRSIEHVHLSGSSKTISGLSSPATDAVAYTLESESPPVWLKTSSDALDFGGIGKGWLADRMARQLREVLHVPCGMVDAGGDLTVWGITPDHPFLIDIQDPWNEQETIAETNLHEGALATSNRIYRRWQTSDGTWLHHLLNPFTGLPSTSPVVQATVHADQALYADIWAKCLCIMPFDQVFDWIANQNGAHAAWLVTEDHKVHHWSRKTKE